MVTEGIDLKKRIFCMILALALILGLAPGVLAAEAGDGTKTITAQPSAAAADAPAVLPEHEPLKNVTGAEPEDVAAHETPKVACVFFTGRNYPPDYYTSIEDAFNAACTAFSAGGITVQLLDSVEMHGDFSLTAQSAITLDLNGHTIRGAKLKLGQGTTRPYALHVKDSAAGSGAIDEIVLCSYYCDLYLDGAVSTTIKQLTFETTDNVRVKLTQGHVAKWYFGPNEQPYANFLASGSLFYAYEDGVLGELLDVSKYNQYGNQGKMVAVRCPHESVQFDATANRYLCNVCKTSVSSGAMLIKADGSSTYYADQTAALAAAQASSDSTLKLLDDWVGRQFTAERGTFTLDLNGKKLYDRQNGGSYPVLLVTGTANLTLINTADTQAQVLCYSPSSIARAIEINSANARLQVGNTDGSASNIDVPHYRSAAALYVTDGTVRLYGGRLGSAKITKTDGMLIDLLPDGRAFSADANGTQIIDLSNKNPKEYWSSLYVVSHTCTFTSSGKCACGRPCTHPSIDSDGKCTICEQGGLAYRLTLADGTIEFYDSYQDALAEAQKPANAGCTLAVMIDTLGVPGLDRIETDGCDFTLDLNGYGLSTSTLFTLTGVNQKVTITNRGAAATLSAGTLVSMSSGSTVTINGNNITFQIKANTQRDGTLVDFAADATAEMKVVINGGTYEKDANSTDNFRLLDIDRPNASVEIRGGTFTETVYVSNGGTLRITGGTFGDDNYYTPYAVNVSNGGKLSVSGSSSNPEFKRELWIEKEAGSVKLSGGRYTNIRYDGYTTPGSHLELLADGYAFYDSNNSSLINLVDNVNGRNLGNVCVMEHDRHTFRGYLDGRCDCGYRCPHENIGSDGYCGACDGSCPAKLENGSDVTYHTTVDFALQNAKDGATITLLDRTDLSLSTSRHVSTVRGKTVTIDLNGHTLDDNEGGQTLQIASDGAVIFRNSGTSGSVECDVELDSGISAENNKTAFLGGTFAEIRCTNSEVLPALAKANKFAFYKAPTWLTLDGLKASPLEGYTAYPVPIWVTTPPAETAEMTYGARYLPEELRLEFGYVDPMGTAVGVTWMYSKDGQDLGRLTTAAVIHGEPADPVINNYRIFDDLPVGTYVLKCNLNGDVDMNGLTDFTFYEGTYTATLTVKQQPATVDTKPTAAENLAYDGQPHALLTSGGTATGGEMVYSLEQDGTYSSTIPAKTDAGTYTIWYKVKADGNHSDTAPAYVEVTIAPCQLSAQVEAKTMYAGDQLPAFTATYSGFVGNDTAETIVQADTAVFATAATGKQAGKFDITMTTAPQLNGGNYELKLSAVTKGTLTVNERPRMPKLPKDDGEKTPESPFDDVTQGDYFFDPVRWAVDEEIAQGVGGGKFAPHAACTRAQIVTMFWRAAGSPEPKGTAGFADIPAGAYYAKAVAWAAEQGIAAGVGGGKFDPHAPCTRAQAVTLLHRAAGAPDTEADAPFADVPTTAYYKAPVAWATEAGITTGVGNGKFAPDATCTRAQIVTMLYRYFKK